MSKLAADGRFGFNNVPAGKYSLSAQRRGNSPPQRYRQDDQYSTAIAVGPGRRLLIEPAHRHERQSAAEALLVVGRERFAEADQMSAKVVRRQGEAEHLLRDRVVQLEEAAFLRRHRRLRPIRREGPIQSREAETCSAIPGALSAIRPRSTPAIPRSLHCATSL